MSNSSPVVFNTLDDLKAHKWIGNHFSDAAALVAFEDWMIKRCKSADEAKSALADVSLRAMGVEADPITDYDLTDYFEAVEYKPELYTI